MKTICTCLAIATLFTGCAGVEIPPTRVSVGFMGLTAAVELGAIKAGPKPEGAN